MRDSSPAAAERYWGLGNAVNLTYLEIVVRRIQFHKQGASCQLGGELVNLVVIALEILQSRQRAQIFRQLREKIV